jgi:dTDP-D-glucose 4,6-dehydratase
LSISKENPPINYIGRVLDEISGVKSDVKFDKDRFGDLRYYVSDISKVKEKLKWEPQVLPRDGITKLIAWIKSNLSLFIINRNLIWT